MAADVIIDNKITINDIRNIRKCGITVTVLLDLTHASSAKPIHLDFRLEFVPVLHTGISAVISKLKQGILFDLHQTAIPAI